MASTTIEYRSVNGNTPVAANYQGSLSPAGNNFPVKLWKLCSEKKYRSIQWGPAGKSIVVNSTIFKDEVLNDAFGMFKTQNFSSFVRQLNLYGFRKIPTARSHETFDFNTNCELHHFQHPHFLQTRPDLLVHVRRSTAAGRRKAAAAQANYCYSHHQNNHPRPPKLSHSAPARQPVFKPQQHLPSFRELLGSHRNVTIPNHQRLQNVNSGHIWKNSNPVGPAITSNRNHRYAPYPTDQHDRNVARSMCDNVIQANIDTRNLPQGIPPSVLFFPPRTQQQHENLGSNQMNPSTSSGQQFHDHSEYPGLALLADTASNSPEMKQCRTNGNQDEKNVFVVEDKKSGQLQARPTTQYYIIKDAKHGNQFHMTQGGHSQFHLIDGAMPGADGGQVVLQLPMVQSQATQQTSCSQMTRPQSNSSYTPITAYLPPGSYINTPNVPKQSSASFLTVSPSQQVLTQFSVSPIQSPHRVHTVTNPVSPPSQSPDKVFSDLSTIPIVSLVPNSTDLSLEETGATEDEKAVKSLLLNGDNSFSEENVMIIPEEDIPVQKTVQIPAQVSEEELVIKGVKIPVLADSNSEDNTGSEVSTVADEFTTSENHEMLQSVSQNMTDESVQEYSSDQHLSNGNVD